MTHRKFSELRAQLETQPGAKEQIEQARNEAAAEVDPPKKGRRMNNATYITTVLGIYHEADLYDGLIWRPVSDGIQFAAICSDTFSWGTADLEDITPDDLPLLAQSLDDLHPHDEEYLLGELFAARKRGMRPMRLWLDNANAVSTDGARDLFLAAGPERDPATEG